MNNWQDRFAPHILERGVNYYKKGKVGELARIDGGYSAFVHGREDYHVEIFLDEGELIGMRCNCPYAESGENCKHMAAVLAALEMSEDIAPDNRSVICFDDEVARRQEEFLNEALYEPDIGSLVENAEREELELFLLSELENDVLMRRRFKVFMTDIVESSELDMYKEQLNDIFESCQDRQGFISYYMARELEEGLYDFIHRIIEEMMLRYGKFEEAFLLSALVMEKTGKAEIDDSDGAVVSVGYYCRDIIRRITDSDNDILKNRIFGWANNIITGDNEHDFIYGIVRGLWFEDFHERLYLDRKKEVILKKLSQWSARTDEYERDWDISGWLDMYFAVSEELGAAEEETADMERRYWQLSVARQHAVSRMMSAGDLRGAAKILKESREIDKGLIGLSAQYTEKLAKIYEFTGDEENAKNELKLLVTKYSPCDLEAFRKLKAYYSEEEWEAVREDIFSGLKGRRELCVLYNEEELYDRLIEYITVLEDIYLVEEYGNSLKELYPEKIIGVYEGVIRKRARISGSRKHYQSIVRLLREMRKYPGGIEAAHRIVKDLRNEYKRRPAMMEELDRL